MIDYSGNTSAHERQGAENQTSTNTKAKLALSS